MQTGRSAAPAGSALARAALARFDQHLERRWRGYLVLICLAVAVFTGGIAARRPLDHDEIFTYYVARQDSLPAIYTALRHGADNHPPIDYWIRHVSMRLFGDGQLAFRLPSMLAFLGSLLGAFALARRHWGAAGGLLALAVLLASQANSMAYFGRSYGLILLWVTLGLLLWRRAADGRGRRLALAGLGVVFASAPCLHFYAPFQMAAVVVAEAARSWRRRALDGAMWAAFACSLLGLPVVLPLLAYARTFSRNFWTPVTLDTVLQTYGMLFVYGMPAFFALLAGWMLLKLAAPDAAPGPVLSPDRTCISELWASVYLCAIPFVIFVLAKSATGAIQPRYSISLVLGVALLLAFAASHSAHLRLAALAVIPVFALGILGTKAAAAFHGGRFGPVSAAVYAIAGQTDLPIVLETPQTFLESAHYAPPALRSRLFYLVDPPAALRIQREDTDQKAMPGLARVAPFQAAPAAGFLREHRRFLLVYEGGWVLARVLEEHPRIQIRYFGQLPLITVDLGAPPAR